MTLSNNSSHLQLLDISLLLKASLLGISKQNLLKSEQSAAKIKRNFSANGGMAGGVNEDAIEQTAITVSLKCPITQQAIRLPARGRDCKHIQCFDLENFLIMNSRKASWSCPVCKYVICFCIFSCSTIEIIDLRLIALLVSFDRAD